MIRNNATAPTPSQRDSCNSVPIFSGKGLGAARDIALAPILKPPG